jgi:hypothetical protein
VTVAFSVAKFTVARTSSIALSLFSTRAAHAAHVIPRIESSTSLIPGDTPLVAADDMPRPPSSALRRRCLAPTDAAPGNVHTQEYSSNTIHAPQGIF